MPPKYRSPIFVKKKIILNLKLFVKNLSSLTILVFYISRFYNLLYMGGVTPTFARSPIFVQNIYI